MTLPAWVILGGQVISGAFILTKITLMVWFCLKQRKSMITLLKIAFPLAKKIQNDPTIIEHLVQQAGDIVTNLLPCTPPPRPATTSIKSAIPTSEPIKSDHTTVSPMTSVYLSSSSTSHAHQCTLEFITEAAHAFKVANCNSFYFNAIPLGLSPNGTLHLFMVLYDPCLILSDRHPYGSCTTQSTFYT